MDRTFALCFINIYFVLYVTFSLSSYLTQRKQAWYDGIEDKYFKYSFSHLD